MSDDYTLIQKKKCKNSYASTDKDFCKDRLDCTLKGIVECEKDEKCKGFQYSQAFDGTRIQLCSDVSDVTDNDEWDIFGKPLPVISNSSTNNNADVTSTVASNEPDNITTQSQQDNRSLSNRLSDLQNKYQDLLDKCQNYLVTTSEKVDDIESDAKQQLAFQEKIITDSSNQLLLDKSELETTIQRIRARIDQIIKYRKTLNILKWVIYILCALAVVVLIIYIYKKLVPGKSSKLDIPVVKTDLPFKPKDITKPAVPRPGVNPKRKFLDDLSDNLLKKPKGNVVAPKPTIGPRVNPRVNPRPNPRVNPRLNPGVNPGVNPGFKPKPTMANLPAPKIDKGGAVVCPNSA